LNILYFTIAYLIIDLSTKGALPRSPDPPFLNPIIEAAAENKYIGETLIEEFLKDSREWKIHPDVATAVVRNYYSPVEVLTLILKKDKGLEITIDTIKFLSIVVEYSL